MRNNLRAALVFSLAVASMAAQSRSAAEILAEFDRLLFPSNSIGSAPAAFRKQVESVATRKRTLLSSYTDGIPGMVASVSCWATAGHWRSMR